MKRRLRTCITLAIAGLGLVACTQAEPSKGSYTLQFPSLEAAITTDQINVLVFDVASDEERSHICVDVITARKRGGVLRPDAILPAVNICNLLAANPSSVIEVPYGEKAILVIAENRDEKDQFRDFLVGCTVQRIGEGSDSVPIALTLADTALPVPPTPCTSIEQFCTNRC